jgi:long-chain acyl-CoA synthetase
LPKGATLYHVYGNVGGLATSLIGRNPVALVPNPRDLNDVLTTIHRLRPAFFPAVPSLLTALLNHPRVRNGAVDFSSLKLCISGGATLLNETRRRLETLVRGRVVDAYSLTEAMNAAVIGPVLGPSEPGAIGLPLPDVQLRIVHADREWDVLGPGEVGEVLLRAPQLMQGYWNRPGETAEIIKDGWLHTGDIGYLDEAGHLFLIDRKKDVIKPGGQQVWPREVEEVLATHPAVQEVAVAGITGDHGEAVKAWVVLRPNRQASREELRTHCGHLLASYKVPRHMDFCESLPKSHVGKILRQDLQRRERPHARH